MEGDPGARGDLTLPSRTSAARVPSRLSLPRRKPILTKSSKEKLSVRRSNVGDGDHKPKPKKASKPIQKVKNTPRNVIQEEFHFPINLDNDGRSSEEFTDEDFEFEMASQGVNLRRFTSNDEPKPNLIVNYLPQTLSDRDFFELFAPFGVLESIKIMRDTETCYSFGYGFVNYFNLDEAIEARNQMNGLQLGHKHIKVSFARPPSDDIKDTNLFVTGLPETVTEVELEKMFAPFGIIVHLRVLRDRKSGTPRGVAFVRFETRAEACAAIFKLNSTVPDGGSEPIRVRLAQDHGKQKAAYLAGYQAALKMTGTTSETDEPPAAETIAETPRVPGVPPPRPPTALPYPIGRPRNVTTVPSHNRPLSALAVVGPHAITRGGPHGGLQKGHHRGLLGSLHESIRLGLKGSLSHRGQIPKAATSISDQTLYWRGFLHGTREPRRADSLSTRGIERHLIGNSSRLKF